MTTISPRPHHIPFSSCALSFARVDTGPDKALVSRAVVVAVAVADYLSNCLLALSLLQVCRLSYKIE